MLKKILQLLGDEAQSLAVKVCAKAGFGRKMGHK